MRIAPISDRVTAVLVGNLNPAIFHPAWFALNKLVSKEDAANAIVRVIHPELSNFDVGELSIQVDKQRFAVACPGRQHEMLRDLIVGSFGNIHRDPYHGPGTNNTNIILAKNFPLGADSVRRLQLRMESDNVFNHTQFLNPYTTYADQTPSYFGEIYQAQASRQTQLAAKIYF